MKNSEIQEWALQVIDRVKKRQNVEDSKEELKAEWPKDFAKVARQIGAHANAARGESILWLIGVDEKDGIKGADHVEFASWLSKVKSQFESEHAPRCYDCNIHIDGETVAALVFETDQSPYVVQNPVHGKKDGGPVSLEVPWRDGTSTRSATRADLLKILVPLRKQPAFEIRSAELEGGDAWSLSMRLDTYITHLDDQPITIPFHRCSLTYQVGTGEEVKSTPIIQCLSSADRIKTGEKEIEIAGTGSVIWQFNNIGCLPHLNLGDKIAITFSFTPSQTDKQTSLGCDFEKDRDSDSYEASYKLKESRVS